MGVELEAGSIFSRTGCVGRQSLRQTRQSLPPSPRTVPLPPVLGLITGRNRLHANAQRPPAT
jgi:hypothetical protein